MGSRQSNIISMKTKILKRSTSQSVLLFLCLFFSYFLILSCSNSKNDEDKPNPNQGLYELWEKITGSSSTLLDNVELLGYSNINFLPYENHDYSVIDQYAYAFYGVKNGKLWVSAYEPNKFQKGQMDKEEGYNKVFEWTDSKDFVYDKRIDKYTTMSINRIGCGPLVLKKNGFALSLTFYGSPKDDPNLSNLDYKMTKFVKDGMEKDSVNFTLSKNLYSWYGDAFVMNYNSRGEMINIDGTSPRIYFFMWDKCWEAVAMDETVGRTFLRRRKLRLTDGLINAEKADGFEIDHVIWDITNEEVAKKLNINFGQKDKIEYQLLKKIDEHIWKYAVHVAYADWDTPDADYEILVDIDKGQLE